LAPGEKCWKFLKKTHFKNKVGDEEKAEIQADDSCHG
jgi:hypothetical protein